MNVTVDVDKCICSGSCVLACPEVFDQDDDGFVVLLMANPSEDLAGGVDEAMSVCPGGVIEVALGDGSADA